MNRHKVRLLFHEIGYPYAVNFPVSDDYLLAWMQAANGAEPLSRNT